MVVPVTWNSHESAISPTQHHSTKAHSYRSGIKINELNKLKLKTKKKEIIAAPISSRAEQKHNTKQKSNEILHRSQPNKN